MKKILPIVGILILSLMLGGLYAISSLKNQINNKALAIQNGCWTVNKNMDLEDSKQRALISLAALFALRETEVLYFIASKDNEGNPLSSKHEYIMEGSTPNARYWSYTIYGNDFFLIDNPENIYGYNMVNIQYIDESNNPELPSNRLGNHQITLSSKRHGDNWLPTGSEDQLYITLRMYNPSPMVYNNLAHVPLPIIKKIGE